VISRARFKFLRSLSRKKARDEEGVFLVEGLTLVEEAVARGFAREILLDAEGGRGPRIDALLASRVPVVELTPEDAAALAETESPQGVFALARNPVRPLEEARWPERALVLLAAGVADPGNFGTLVRTAAALGAAALVATPGTVEPTNPKAVRASAGALFRLRVLRGDAAGLKRAGFAILVADATGTPVGNLRTRPARLALAVGSEPKGVDEATRRLAAGTVAVPLDAGVESLNVAVAAGILLHALRPAPA